MVSRCVLMFINVFLPKRNEKIHNIEEKCVLCLDDNITVFSVRCSQCTFAACFDCAQRIRDNKCPQCRVFIHLRQAHLE